MDGDLSFEVSDVLLGACAHVVEDCDGVTAGDEGICKMRADETGSACDECAH